MFKKYIAGLSLMLSLSTLLGSCVRDNDFFGTDDSEANRKQIVRIVTSDDVTIVSRDAMPLQEEFPLIQISRDPNNAGELNQPLAVKLALKPELLPAGYTALPADAYQLVGGMDVTFQPGEFQKFIPINVDKSKLDLSKKYGLAVGIESAGTGMVSNQYGTAVYEVGIKNEWHGDYQATGVFTHPTAGPRDIDEPKELLTSGARSVRAPLGDLGAAGYYMILTINQDNTVTVTPSGVTPNVDQSWGPNFYDPATKSFNLHYSYNTAAPRIVKEKITRL